MSDLSDDALDGIVRQIIENFPSFGRRMLNGHLRYLGHRVPRSRLQASYHRVRGGPSSNQFGTRRIEQRVYSVPGPNSLWHHDGQHGMFFSLTTMPNKLNPSLHRPYSLEDSNSCIH